MRALLVALPLVFAGCVEVPASTTADPISAPWTLTHHLRADGTMIELPDAEAVVPLAWGWRQWLDGVEPPVWTSAPATRAYVVTSAIATVVYEATAPATTTGSRPEWTVWFGAGEGTSDHAFAPGPPALAPGQRETVVYELRLPLHGLVVAPGETLSLAVGSYYTDDAQRGAVAVVLGDGWTRLDLEVAPLTDLPTPRQTQTSEQDVSLLGGRCMGLDPATDQDLAWIDVAADPAKGRLVGIDVDVAHAGGTGPPDIDFVLLDAEGEPVGRSQGPAGVEQLRLREPNLVDAAPDAVWRLGVYSCTPQRSEASVVVAMHYF